MLTVLDLFSGIGGFSLGLERSGGFKTVAFAEIEPFPCAVLAHHFPGTPNLGDVTHADVAAIGPVDVVCGGSPCQSFSVAGKRAGLDDPRGNLALVMLALVGRVRPRWVVYENVPGLLSIDGGRTFGTFLGFLGQLGYGFAYRVLNAEHFGVPQRRRRVFVVGCLGGWAAAAAVLFERHSLSGNPPPSREARASVAGALAGVSPGGGWRVGADEAAAGQLIANALTAREQKGPDSDATTTLIAHPLRAQSQPSHRADSDTYVAHSLRADGFDASEDGTGRGTPLVPVTADTLTAFWERSKGAKAGNQVGVLNPIIYPSAVRRLTPRECERLQGFPDNWTTIPYRGKPAADGPRYKALGNSVAVPVISWLGERILMVDSLRRAA